ncbi:MAG: hypothetical protein ACI4R8_00870 [Candidatus Caccovivens sp.]
MVWYEEFLHWLQGKMETPTWFGWYHILWLGIMVVACTLIYIFRNRISRKDVNITLLVAGIVLIVLEIYKQIIYSFNYNGGGGNSTWDYQWYAFPFQFCSTPMYLMLLAGILRKGKVYDALLGYLATFAFFGGLCVMIYTGDVFSSYIGINIHTMIWHCSMVVIGFMILATRSVPLNLKTVLKASIVFACMIAIALILNIIWHYCGNEETFNMFFISPYYPCTLALMNIIYQTTPYPVFLLIYIIGFVLVAFIIMGFAMLFAKLESIIQKRKNSKNTQ